MAGRGDIKAGAAFVELMLKDSAFVKGLRSASKKLKDFGSGITAIGAGFTAMGAGILAPLAGAVKEYLEVGDALDKMRQRTGISVEALSELGHAAEQSGTDLGTVEKAVKAMQKGIVAGDKDIAALGISLESLKAMTPEQQFDTLAKAVGDIQDPTQRAAAALAVFGKAGTQLLPMIEDMDALREEAKALGFTMSGESAAASVKLGDMLANLWKSVKFGAIAIGEALAPALTELAGTIQRVATGAIKWIKDNKGLVVTIAKVGVAVLAAGAAITALGVSFVGIGVVLGGIVTAMGVVGTIIGALLSPIGLLITALVAGVAAWATWTESGQKAVAAVKGFFGPLLGIVKDTLGGIADALMAGDLEKAGKIGLAGLKAVFLQGVASLSSAIGGTLGDLFGTIGQQIAGGDFAGAWETAVQKMASLWDAFAAGILGTFGNAINGIMNMWLAATGEISDAILQSSKEGGWLGKLGLAGTGIDMAELQKQEEARKPKNIKAAQGNLAQAREALARAESSDTGRASLREGGPENTADEIRAYIEDLEKNLRRAGGLTADVTSEAQANARDQLKGTADAVAAAIADAPAKAAASAEAIAKKTAGGSTKAQEAADAAKAELDKLNAEAAAARAKKDAETNKGKGGGSGGGEAEGGPKAETGKGSTAGTFSATEAMFLGAPGADSPELRTAKAAEGILKEAEQINENTAKPKQLEGKGFIEFGPRALKAGDAKQFDPAQAAKDALAKNLAKQSGADPAQAAKDALAKNLAKQSDPAQAAKDALAKNLEKQSAQEPPKVEPPKKSTPADARAAELQRRRDAYEAEMQRRRDAQPKREKWAKQEAKPGDWGKVAGAFGLPEGGEDPFADWNMPEPEPGSNAARMRDLQRQANEARAKMDANTKAGDDRARAAAGGFSIGGPPTERVARAGSDARQSAGMDGGASEEMLAKLDRQIAELTKVRQAIEKGGVYA